MSSCCKMRCSCFCVASLAFFLFIFLIPDLLRFMVSTSVTLPRITDSAAFSPQQQQHHSFTRFRYFVMRAAASAPKSLPPSTKSLPATSSTTPKSSPQPKPPPKSSPEPPPSSAKSSPPPKSPRNSSPKSPTSSPHSSPPSAPPSKFSSPSSSGSNVIIIATIVGSVVPLILLLGFWKWKRRTTSRGNSLSLEPPELFTLEELIQATRNFSEENKLGGGNFGAVYKGKLSDGSDIAVRDLSASGEERSASRLPSAKLKKDIVGKLARLNELRHKNLVELRGYCVDDDPKSWFNRHKDGPSLLLVYEYMGGGSLDKRLNDSEMPLDWHTRFMIVNDVAKGLTHMHVYSPVGALAHCSIKAKNILLVTEDQVMNVKAKISNAGLSSLASRWKAKNPTSDDTPKGQKFKNDIIDFGYLALEIVFGTQEKRQLREKANNDGSWFNTIDPRLQEELSDEEMMREVKVVLMVALRCVSETYPTPSILEVEKWLTTRSLPS